MLFVVIFLGILILIGTTIVITTIIERSYKVDFFKSSSSPIDNANSIKKCDLLEEKTRVISLSEDKLAVICDDRIEIINLSNDKIEKIFNY
ncbi:hypothetical protein OA530_01045 [Pelagibacteraceae bacterium]|nr:hypothetical protein [Pelagibacteraceae bacterium]